MEEKEEEEGQEELLFSADFPFIHEVYSLGYTCEPAGVTCPGWLWAAVGLQTKAEQNQDREPRCMSWVVWCFTCT